MLPFCGSLPLGLFFRAHAAVACSCRVRAVLPTAAARVWLPGSDGYGRSGDRGIDGPGILYVNALVSFKVLFQCKRYAASVSPSHVRDFRGAMTGRADKGIIITTGSFTSDARKEAVRDGAPPIELVDGERLVSMLEKAGARTPGRLANLRTESDVFRRVQEVANATGLRSAPCAAGDNCV